tara:strand:+ start:344 stop:1066 length:723 start_codon:yes stop_codon:yes gene_type:complete
MAFTNHLNILPDPNNPIGDAGETGGSAGVGFASVQLSSEQPTMRDFTNSGRILARAIARHQWKVNISYNPMTEAEFNPVYTFLLHRRGGLNPFFVSLPQYRVPQDVTFASYAASNNLEAIASYSAGVTQVILGKTGYSNTTNKTPTPGDLFTVSGTNSNHLKAYMVTRVENSSNYQTGTTQPSTSQVKIYFTPGFSKGVGQGDDFLFHNPLIKVIAKDTQQYSLDTNNLYKYSLQLEEVQ